MNKKILMIIFLFGIIFFTGCGKSKIEYEKHLISFYYSYGNKETGFFDYIISVDTDYIKYTTYGTSNNARNLNTNIDKLYVEKISNIINKYYVLDWDGYNKHKDKESSEIVFSIQIGYDDGSNYSASGYMNYPKNFDKVHKELLKIFNELNK